MRIPGLLTVIGTGLIFFSCQVESLIDEQKEPEPSPPALASPVTPLTPVEPPREASLEPPPQVEPSTALNDLENLVMQVYEQAGPGVVNVAGKEVVSIRTMADAIGKELGVEPKLQRVPESRATDLIADTSLLEQAFHAELTPFSLGLERTIEAYVRGGGDRVAESG